jgi:hypothetical protein
MMNIKVLLYLVRVYDDLALLLLAARDEEHVVERGRVVQDVLVLERGQHVARTELEEVHSALVNRKPQGLGPVGRKRLLK